MVPQCGSEITLVCWAKADKQASTKLPTYRKINETMAVQNLARIVLVDMLPRASKISRRQVRQNSAENY
jgi:hypothetical protein